MIIKRRNQLKSNRPAPGSGDAAGMSWEELAAKEAEPQWTPEAVDAGDAEDRRLTDRRNGWRRIEDKNLISRAHEEANAIRENAQREGFEDGLRQANEAVENLREMMAQMLLTREDAMESIVDDIAPIAVEIAERIIKTEVSCDETLVLNIVRDTLQKAGRNHKSILIKVHPDDVRLVKQDLKENPPVNLNAELIVVDEPTVDRGSCIIETNSGLIDASFATRLEILRRLFGGEK